MKNKIQEIKLSEFIQVLKPRYVYLKLTPNNSLRNNGTNKIAKTISLLYANIFKAIQAENAKVINFFGKDTLFYTKYSIQLQSKVLYYVYIEKGKVEFYFMIPDHYLSVMTEKIKDTWSNLTITQVTELPRVSDSALSYQLLYKHEDGLSLETDRRTNDLLSSNLNIINVLEEGDQIAIMYNFMPTPQFGWPAQYKNTLEKVKRKESTLKNKANILYVFQFLANLISETFNLLSDPLKSNEARARRKDDSLLTETLIKLNNRVDISTSTAGKANQVILNTQIIVQSDSPKALNKINNAKSICQSFDSISGDNSLVPVKINKRKIAPIESFSLVPKYNKMSTSECSNFIALPGRELLDQYKIIDKVETQELDIPEDLREGIMNIGTVTYRGKQKKAYLSSDFEYQFLTLNIIGPSRAGKSNLIGHLTIDAIAAGECVIIFDFCGNCELSNTISTFIPEDKTLIVDCSDYSKMQGMGYNEIRKTDDIFEQYRNAKEQASQLVTLIDTVNTQDKAMSPKMERYLLAAALVVFISNGSIKDVFDILQNHVLREKFLYKIPDEHLENLEEYLMTLLELDEIKDGKVIGTQYSKVSGIMDRLHKLKKNTYIELMLKKDTTNNFDLVDEMQKNQLICLKMPEVMFMTDEERDIYCTYWMTKIWMSLQIRKWAIPDRKDLTKVNIVIDELYQVNQTEAFLTSKLSRLAKFSAKPIISCHYINQMKTIRDELRSANASYMLVSGCDSKNYQELKTELAPFTEEDLLKLKEFHSLNYIKCKSGYARFITKLPPKLE